MLNPLSLEGRTVLVTGASSGIGRETAILLDNLGARLILVGRNRERLCATARLAGGDRHTLAVQDLTAIPNVTAWMKDLTQTTGRLHGLVHCAGISITKPLASLKAADMSRILDINVTAGVELSRAFRQCVDPEGASIVLVSSIMGLVGARAAIAYSASKGAITALVRSMALELAQERIRVNAVAPGHVSTEMSDELKERLTPEQYDHIKALHPLGIGQAIDVAYAIAFLLADTGRWITGSTLVVDGGYTAQ